MKTILISLAIWSAAFAGAAQSLSPGDVISRTPTTPSVSPPATNSNPAVDSASVDRLAEQLHELHQVVADTLPLLNSLTQSNAIPGDTTSSGGLAGILGGILNRTNQNSADGTARTNGVLAGILQGILGTNSAASTATNAATLSDLAVVRQQLEILAPVLERLAPANSDQIARPSSGSSTNDLAPTGRR